MSIVEKSQVMDASTAQRALRRIANEIIEKEEGCEDVVLVGIHRGGVPMAKRIAAVMEELEGFNVPIGTIDITLYRDDLFEGLPRPEIGSTELPFKLSAKKVVLVDDVLFTGRTIRAALDALNDYGRPRRVRVAVLVDRGASLRELPIQADYIGKIVDTTQSQTVKVVFDEKGDPCRVIILERSDSE